MAKNAHAKRTKLKAIIADKNKPMEERFAATLKLAAAAAQFVADPHSQPLRADGPSALGLPQDQAQPYRDARTRLQGPGSGPREVELVREGRA